MGYKLIEKVPAVPRNCNSFDAHLIYSNVTEAAQQAGSKTFHWGTPRYSIGHIAQDLDEMRGFRKGFIGKIYDFFKFAEQYRNEWGVWIEQPTISSSA